MHNRQKIRTSRMQQYIRELIQEEGLDLESQSSEEEQEQDGDAKKTKRGRKKIPERWTRVISIHKDDWADIRTYELGPELLLDQSLSGTTAAAGKISNWRPLYWIPTSRSSSWISKRRTTR